MFAINTLVSLSRRTTGVAAAATRRPAQLVSSSSRSYAQVVPSKIQTTPTIDVSAKLPTHYSKDGKPKEKLVILGSGWAGYTLLRAIDKDKYDTYLVSPNTYFAMTPLLASAATGALEFRNVMEPVRETFDTYFWHAYCDGIDFANKKVHLTPAYPPPFRAADPTLPPSEQQQGVPTDSIPNARGGHSSAMVRPPHRRAIEGSEVGDEAASSKHHSHDPHESWKSQEEGRTYALPYDKLVIACGTYNRTFNTAGVKQNAWFLKDVQNSRAIRYRILECFEQAEHPDMTDEQRRNILHFVVVGGGPTGAEFAAALYDLIQKDIKRIFPKLQPLARITIFDAAGGILNTFDESLQEYARKRFIHDGIELKLNRKPVRVERGKFVVEPDGEVPFGMLVWSTGNCQGPLIKSINEAQKDKSGALLTNGLLEVLAASKEGEQDQGQGSTEAAASVVDGAKIDGVYALGDCAQIADYVLPATAQVASQKASYLAALLNGKPAAMGADGQAKHFKWKNKGSMTRLSSGTGIAQIGSGKLEGRPASALWHSTYGLYLTITWRTKIGVAVTWVLNALFGRSLSRM